MDDATEYAPAKTEEWNWYSPIFKLACAVKKYLKDTKHNSLHLAWEYTLGKLFTSWKM